MISRLFRSWGLLAFLGLTAQAHVGSPDVYLDGKAGPYQLFVTIRPPLVIPGVAEVEIRSETTGVRHIRAVPLPIAGAGAQFAPVADKLAVSPQDSQFFTGSLWMMAPGSWQVRITADGDQGEGTISVPVPSAALTTKKMQPILAGLLSLLGLFLVGGIVVMTGASVREAKLPAGVHPPLDNQRKASRAMAVAFLIVAGVVLAGAAWWNAEASSYRDRVYKPLQMSAALAASGELTLRMIDTGWFSPKNAVQLRRMLFTRTIDDLVPDHNHLMHLYAIRQPGLDVVYHLHPDQAAPGTFQLKLPYMQPGNYRLYADIVHANGFPDTLVTSLVVPRGLPGRSLEGDDASGTDTAWQQADRSNTSFRLPDGYVMRWLQDGRTLRPRQPQMFRFELTDDKGQPARNMEFYMGMLGHAAFVKVDGTAFAHIHPTGSVSMTALGLAQKSLGQRDQASTERTTGNMPGMDMSGMAMPGDTAQLPNQVGFPYGFPSAGRYRIFVQMKHSGVIETGIFDADVQ